MKKLIAICCLLACVAPVFAQGTGPATFTGGSTIPISSLSTATIPSGSQYALSNNNGTVSAVQVQASGSDGGSIFVSALLNTNSTNGIVISFPLRVTNGNTIYITNVLIAPNNATCNTCSIQFVGTMSPQDQFSLEVDHTNGFSFITNNLATMMAGTNSWSPSGVELFTGAPLYVNGGTNLLLADAPSIYHWGTTTPLTPP